jgi:hypothetical protein
LKGYSALQQEAVWYAVVAGFKGAALQALVAEAFTTSTTLELRKLPRGPVAEAILQTVEYVFGTSNQKRLLGVVVVLEDGGARWTKDGWVARKIDFMESAPNSLQQLKHLPKFHGVTQSFVCAEMMLATLEGAPRTVGGDFSCQDNNLLSLEGGPEQVGRDYVCAVNALRSLKGAPKKIPGDFDCEVNKLSSLKHGPEAVGGNYTCSDNELNSLKGAPKKVGGDFDCMDNYLDRDSIGPLLKSKILGNVDTDWYAGDWPPLPEDLPASLRTASSPGALNPSGKVNVRGGAGGSSFEEVSAVLPNDSGEMPVASDGPSATLSMVASKSCLNRERAKKGPPSPIPQPSSQPRAVVASGRLEKWLQEPTYDYTPDEIYEEIEADTVASDTWDVLIEQMLPALRRGNRATLDAVRHNLAQYTSYQLRAIFLALVDGFEHIDVANYAIDYWLGPPVEHEVPDYIWDVLFEITRQKTPRDAARVLMRLYHQAVTYGKDGWETDDYLDLKGAKLEVLPPIARVGLDFTCSSNPKLKSLAGCPRIVGGSFNCNENGALRSLKGGPVEVGGSFRCHNCDLRSLRGGPTMVGGSYVASSNKELSSLEGAPKIVPENFVIMRLPKLRNLKGGPQVVGDHYQADNTGLTSLEGAPREVGQSFGCIHTKLKSLKPLADSKIKGDVETDFGTWYAGDWPPGPGDPRYEVIAATHPPVKVAISQDIERWLHHPSWDDMPEPIVKELEDTALGELWSELVDSTLPALRRGNRQTLSFYEKKNLRASYSIYQRLAVLYAARDGLDETEFVGFALGFYLANSGAWGIFPDLFLDVFEVAFNTRSINAADEYIQRTYSEGAAWTDDGWVCPKRVSLNSMKAKITKLPRFHIVNGYFDISGKQLPSLEGCPRVVKGRFDCPYNHLTSLEGGPDEVWHGYDCAENRLTTLRGAPEKVGGDFNCSGNKLRDFVGAPREVDGYLWCKANPRLKSMKGAPEKVRLGAESDWYYVDPWPGSPEDQRKFLGLPKGKKATKERPPSPPGRSIKQTPRTLDRESRDRVVGAARSLKDWLKNPSYDDMPPEVDEELEDNALGEMWDILIETVLPALRRGHRATLDGLYGGYQGYSSLQQEALLSAVEDGFGKDGETFPQFVIFLERDENVDLPMTQRVKEVLWEVYGTDDRKVMAKLYKKIAIDGQGSWARGGWSCLGSVVIPKMGLTKLPKFQDVNGYFDCSENKLTSLEGAPDSIHGAFTCADNKLTSLKGCTTRGVAKFYCHNNKLTSLVGGPPRLESGNAEYSCGNNPLKSLKGAPQKVTGDFWCEETPLRTLEGAPDRVGGDFNCYESKLTSLKGAPQGVARDFNCFENSLSNLEGAPAFVGGDFSATSNPLKSLKGFPKKLEGEFTADQIFRSIDGSWSFSGFPKDKREEWLRSVTASSPGLSIKPTVEGFDRESRIRVEGAGGSLEKWLKAPTYDWTPDEIYDEVEEDVVASELWDALIEKTLPALRQGNKHILEFFSNPDNLWEHNHNQIQAIIYAVADGFPREKAALFVQSFLRFFIPEQENFDFPASLNESLVLVTGTEDHSLAQQVLEQLTAPNRGDCTWTDDGWVCKGAWVELNDARLVGKHKLTRLPKFKEVRGNLNLQSQKLTSLEGCPERVGGSFNCYNNQLTSLEGGPKEANDYSCDSNKLRSLQGAPQKIPGGFYCSRNLFTDLRGAPREVGTFTCNGPYGGRGPLKSLKGAPRKVGGDFSCTNQSLTSLKGAPQKVYNFNVMDNHLKNLDGAPTEVGNGFNCLDNPIEDIRGIANSKIGGEVYTPLGNFLTGWPEPYGQREAERLDQLRAEKKASQLLPLTSGRSDISDSVGFVQSSRKEVAGAARFLEEWLRAPTYDWTPDEVYDEVEGDAVASDVWDILIETTIPALWAGKRSVLPTTRNWRDYTPLQVRAVGFAIQEGQKKGTFTLVDLLYAEEGYQEAHSWGAALLFPEAVEMAYGKSVTDSGARHGGKNTVLYNLNLAIPRAGGKWSPQGWVCPASVSLNDIGLRHLPPFKEVKQDFSCSHNVELSSLEGAPRKVGGSFDATSLPVTNLTGAPQEVKGTFVLRNLENLTSLKGGPQTVKGSYIVQQCGQLKNLEGAPRVLAKANTGFQCTHNGLTSLKGAPREVWTFVCHSNPGLKNLKGAPRKVHATFNCEDCEINSLEGAPKKVGGDFKAGKNALRNLEGGPEEVGGTYDIMENRHTLNYDHLPEKVGGTFLSPQIIANKWPPSPSEVARANKLEQVYIAQVCDKDKEQDDE